MKAAFVASFIGQGDKAIWAALSSGQSPRPINHEQFWAIPSKK